jgi:folate-dependent phosphoribosylglycinamide formyltransferase PurN
LDYADEGGVRLAILTSTDTRHRFFAQSLREAFPVVAVVYEQTGYSPADVTAFDLSPDEVRIVGEHFAERTRQEQRFFGHRASFLEDGRVVRFRHVSAGELNSAATLRFVKSAGTDTVAVFGTNLIRPPLLEAWPGRMINLHLGLSPYYRGTATNFYPLLNEEPEYVGATIHLIDEGIDSGPILGHARPDIQADDLPHTIGCKAILAGIQAMVGVLRQIERGTAKPTPQWPVPNARLYLRKHYHPRQVVELDRKIEGGLIRRFVENGDARRRKVRLIEF